MYWSLENVPWTNLHDLNLDWIVNTMKQTVEQWIAYRAEMDEKYEDFTTQVSEDFDTFTNQINEDFDTFTSQINNWKNIIESDFADLQQYVQNYFDNLDLNESTRYVINQMIASGEFIQVLNPSIVSATEAWLASHVTPTSPVVDNTLTISGAAADAKATGDGINKALTDFSDPLNLLFSATVVRNRYYRMSESGYIRDYDYFIVPVVSGETYYIHPGCRYFSKRNALIYENQTQPFSYTADFTGDIYVSFNRNTPGWIMTKEQDYSLIRPCDTPSFFNSALKHDPGTSQRYPMSQKGVTDLLDNTLLNLFEVSKNLVDPSTRVLGAITSDGTLRSDGAWDAYLTTDFIPLDANTDYTFSLFFGSDVSIGRKLILLYTANQTPVTSTFINQAAAEEVVFNSGNNYKYVRLSGQHMYNFQLEKASHHTAYQPYSTNYLLNTGLGTTPLEQVDNLINYALSSYGKTIKTIIKSGNTFSVESKINNKTLLRNYRLNYGNNSVFNFASAIYNGDTIRGNSDDITPQRIKINSNDSVTVGANHGWSVVLQCEAGSLTNVDVGSTWTDGVTVYTLVSVYNGYAYFCPPVDKISSIIYVQATPAVANLTHVNGATHTTAIPRETLSVGQLFPSINKHTSSLHLDGKEITDDGIYYAAKIEVHETYEIVDLYALVNYAISHIGNVNIDNVSSLLTVNYVYDIQDNCEVVYTNLLAKQFVNIKNSGFLQAEATTPVNGTLYRYVNGVASGTFASNSRVNMTNYNTNTLINANDTITGQTPNRSVDLCVNNSNYVIYGFAIGFFPDISYGSDSHRNNNTIMWDMRATKKSYPYCVENKDLQAYEQINVAGYRVYFAGQAPTDMFTIETSDKTYCIIDAHSKFTNNFNVEKYGADVVTLNSDNLTFSDCVGSNGVSCYSRSNYSAGVAVVK